MNRNAKSQATTEQLRPKSNGAPVDMRTQWQALQDNMKDMQHTLFDPTRLTELSEKLVSVTEQLKQPHPDATNGQVGENGMGVDPELQSKTVWWGLIDAAKAMEDTKARLMKSVRLSQMAMAEVACASSAVADHEGVLVRAQGEIILRRQEVRHLQEQVKRLVAELKEKDDAAARIFRSATNARDVSAACDTGDAHGANGTSQGDEAKCGTTCRVKWVADMDGKVLNDVIKLIDELEFRYSLVNESLERTHTMFQEALSLVVPEYASRLADKAVEASDAAAQAAVDAGEDHLVL